MLRRGEVEPWEERGKLGVFEQNWSLLVYVVKETADLTGQGVRQIYGAF